MQNINYSKNLSLFKLLNVEALLENKLWYKSMTTSKIAPLQICFRLKHDNLLAMFKRQMTSKYFIILSQICN